MSERRRARCIHDPSDLEDRPTTTALHVTAALNEKCPGFSAIGCVLMSHEMAGGICNAVREFAFPFLILKNSNQIITELEQMDKSSLGKKQRNEYMNKWKYNLGCLYIYSLPVHVLYIRQCCRSSRRRGHTPRQNSYPETLWCHPIPSTTLYPSSTTLLAHQSCRLVKLSTCQPVE
jgi:hypothetical protein